MRRLPPSLLVLFLASAISEAFDVWNLISYTRIHR